MDFTAKDLIDKVREVAAREPERTYSRTVHPAYFDSGYPACLIGHGLADLGVTVDDVGDQFNTCRIGQLLDHLDIASGPDESIWLMFAQEVNDEGYPWGDALKVDVDDNRKA